VRNPYRAAAALLTATFAMGDLAVAQGKLGASRDFDLNTYALGANIFASTSPYDGIERFVVVYPAPTKFEDPLENDGAFFIRDGDVGLRAQLANGWDLGGVASIQTLGYGSSESPALIGMSRRNWTIQGGLTFGRSFGKARADLTWQTDLLGEHDGEEYELKLARVFDHGNYYLMPQVEATYQSAKLVDHYFGVTAREALPERPEYHPGAAITYRASLEWSWKWHPRWFVTAGAGIALLPPEIRSSPIVDKAYTWTASVGFAYDAPTMMEAGSARPAVGAGIEITLGAFFVNADSLIFLTNGVETIPINLEPDLSLDDAQVSVPVELIWRIGTFHRLELGYFELQRSGAKDLTVPVDIGNVSFPAGETVSTSFDTRIVELGYAFSLLHDAQKELSVFGGAYVSATSFRSGSDSESVAAKTTSILPALGADVRVALSERLSVGAKLRLFVADVDRYSGNSIDLAIFGQYAWHERISVGAGFRFHRQDIDSADEDFFGDYRFGYRGPYVFVRSRL